MSILWAAQAVEDVAGILESVPAGRPAEAHEVCDRIEQAVAILGEFPEAGYDGRVSGTRETVVPTLPYVIVYRIAGGDVVVISLCRETPGRKD